MKIAILGTGNVGSTLGKRWSAKGHDITFGTRHPGSERVDNLVNEIGNGTRALPLSEAAVDTNVVVLATPWSAAETILDQVGSLEGRVLIDTTNPLADGLSGLSIDSDTSASEMISQWCPGAHVVKAFNTVSLGNMLNPGQNGKKVSTPICGNHGDAKNIVKELAGDLDFEVFDAGDITSARYIEPMAMLWVTLTYKQGVGPDVAFKMIKRKIESDQAA